MGTHAGDKEICTVCLCLFTTKDEINEDAGYFLFCKANIVVWLLLYNSICL